MRPGQLLSTLGRVAAGLRAALGCCAGRKQHDQVVHTSSPHAARPDTFDPGSNRAKRLQDDLGGIRTRGTNERPLCKPCRWPCKAIRGRVMSGGRAFLDQVARRDRFEGVKEGGGPAVGAMDDKRRDAASTAEVAHA